MNSLLLDMGMAIWFGVLTSISPCPLATNITAISFIGRRVDRAGYVLSAGMLYMLGRMFTYAILGSLIVSSTQFIRPVAMFLQTYMVYVLSPALIILGILLLEIVKPTLNFTLFNERLQTWVNRSGIWGAGILGIVFALSFCPISAALFFGSLFSLAMKHDSRLLMPSLYGIGTAIPVVVFAFLLAFSAHLVGKVFDKLSTIEWIARRITGIVFILAGLYLGLTQIVHLF